MGWVPPSTLAEEKLRAVYSWNVCEQAKSQRPRLILWEGRGGMGLEAAAVSLLCFQPTGKTFAFKLHSEMESARAPSPQHQRLHSFKTYLVCLERGFMPHAMLLGCGAGNAAGESRLFSVSGTLTVP